MQTERRSPTRASGVFGAVGGALMIAAYFLPANEVVANPNATAGSQVLRKLVSPRDVITPLLFGDHPVEPITGNAALFPQPFTAVEALAPVVVAAIILCLGLWTCFQRPGPVSPARRAVSSAAVALAVLATKGVVDVFGFGKPTIYTSLISGPSGAPALWVAPDAYIGPAVFLLGVFFAMISVFLDWQREARVLTQAAGLAGAFGAVGGALVVVSYFLPATMNANAGANTPFTPAPNGSVLSIWDTIVPLFSFGPPSGSDVLVSTDASGYGRLFTLTLLLAPLVAGALLLILGMVAWARRSSPVGAVRRAVSSVAVVTLALALIGAFAFFKYYGSFSVGAAVDAQSAPVMDMGPVVFLCGAFLALLAVFLDWQRADVRAPARVVRLAGPVSALGGALIIGSYFLPAAQAWSDLTANPPYHTRVVTAWGNIMQALFVDPSSGGASGFDFQNPHVFTLLVVLAPMIEGAVVLYLGAWAWFRRPGPGRRAVWFAAVAVAALALWGSVAGYGGGIGDGGYTWNAIVLLNDPLLGLGPVVFLGGVLLAVLAVFLTWRGDGATAPAKPSTRSGQLGALGGALIVAAYFLPATLATDAQGQVISSPAGKTLSIWDTIAPRLSVNADLRPVSSGVDLSGIGHVFTAILLLAPLLAGTVLLILGLVGWRRRARPAGAMRLATFAAAVALAAMAVASTMAFFGYEPANQVYIGGPLVKAPFLSLGPLVLLCGVFFAIVSAHLGYWRGEPEPAG